MKISFQKITALLITLVLLLVCAAGVTASAEETSNQVTEKTFEVEFTEASGTIRELPAGRASFWEYPILHGGEKHTQGKFTIINKSAAVINVTLKQVELPYTDQTAMAYLNHLHLTISQGAMVLYSNTYAHIADASGGLQIQIQNLKPEEQREYSVSMYCDYGYTGDPLKESQQISWMFSADSDMWNPSGNAPSFPLIGKLLMTLVIVLFVGLVIFVLVVYLRKHNHSAEEDEPTTDEENHNLPPDRK